MSFKYPTTPLPTDGELELLAKILNALNAGGGGGGGGVNSVTASSPLFSSGGANPNITEQQASGAQAGYLSAADWNTFNGKQSALGFTPINKAGDSGIGALSVSPAAGVAITLQPPNNATDSLDIKDSGGVIQSFFDAGGNLTVNGIVNVLTLFPQTVDHTGGGAMQWGSGIDDGSTPASPTTVGYLHFLNSLGADIFIAYAQ